MYRCMAHLISRSGRSSSSVMRRGFVNGLHAFHSSVVQKCHWGWRASTLCWTSGQHLNIPGNLCVRACVRACARVCVCVCVCVCVFLASVSNLILFSLCQNQLRPQ